MLRLENFLLSEGNANDITRKQLGTSLQLPGIYTTFIKHEANSWNGSGLQTNSGRSFAKIVNDLDARNRVSC